MGGGHKVDSVIRSRLDAPVRLHAMVLNYLVDVLSKGRNAPYAPHPICDDSWAARGRWLGPELLEDQLTERWLSRHTRLQNV